MASNPLAVMRPTARKSSYVELPIPVQLDNEFDVTAHLQGSSFLVSAAAGMWFCSRGYGEKALADIIPASVVRWPDLFQTPPIRPENIYFYRAISPEEIQRYVAGIYEGEPSTAYQIEDPHPLDQILSAINELCRRQETEDIPTARACESARQILLDADRIAHICLDATAVEASEGDLLIHWDAPARSVVLICARDGHTPSIYTETLEGVRPTGSNLRNNASAQLLSEALAWVSSPL